MTTIFAPLTKVERHGGMLLVEATARVAGGVTAAAVRKIADRTLGQMFNPEAVSAGRITGVTVDPGGAITIKAQITDRPAQLKASARVYPGLSVKFTGDEIDEVCLVDRDFSKLSKGAGMSDTVLVKIYGKEIAKMTPLMRALKKVEDRMKGSTAQLSADERAALLAQPAVAARMAELQRIELGVGDLRQRQQAESNALVVIKAAQQRPIQNDSRFVVR